MSGVGLWNELDRVEKRSAILLLILCHVGLTSSIMIAAGIPQAESYEFSILQSYPPYLWVLILYSLFCSFASLSISYGKSRLWIVSLLSSLLALTLLFALPIIRGYFYFGGSDSLYHISSIVKMAQSGYINPLDYYGLYPLLHILGAEIHLTTGLGSNFLTLPILITFYVIFVLSLLTLSRYLSIGRRGQTVVLVLGLMPLLGMETLNFAPFAKAIMFLPLSILVYVRRGEMTTGGKKFSILLVALAVALVFYHVLAAALFIAVVIAFDIIHFAEKRILPILGIKLGGDGVLIKKSYPYVALIALISIIWVPNSAIFRDVKKLILGLFNENAPNEGASQLVDLLEVAKLSDVLIIGLTTYGAVAVLLLLTALLFTRYAILPMLRKESIERIHWQLAAMSILFLGFTITTYLISDSFGTRPLSVALIFLVLLMGALIPRIMMNTRGVAIVCIVIILLGSILLLGLYPTPLNKSSNWQMTEPKATGIEWVAGSAPFAPYIYYNDGDYDRASRYVGGIYVYYAHIIPDHYDFSLDVGSKWNESIVVLTDHTLDFYPNQYPNYREYWRYDQNDVQRFQASGYVATIYSSNGFYVYHLKQQSSESNS